MEGMALRGSRRLWGRPLLRLAQRSINITSPQRLRFSCSSRLERKKHNQGLEEELLVDSKCRTRFAPSPTGYLHLGSLRTALFNYLLARATGGQFVVRIEDTDQTRLVADAEETLYSDLAWAGLSWDEGPDVQGPYGPYRQSERLPLYQEHADRLLREGKAFRCFCSPETLEEHKRAALAAGQPPSYPGTCRSLSQEESDDRAHRGEPFAILFKSPNPPARIYDIIHGSFQPRQPDADFTILKRDGFPTYHFANVVDDHHMKITHVVRGAEWLISTPKHVALYQAFDWVPPRFAHLGLLVDEFRQKLSKRDNSASVSSYRSEPVLPHALVNFAALLGWRGLGPSSPNGDVMTLQEMVDNFSLKFTRGDIGVPRKKLDFLQRAHLNRMLKDRTPENAAALQQHVLVPIKEAVELIQADKDRGKAAHEFFQTTPGEIGTRLTAPRILEDDFLPALVDVVNQAAELYPVNRFVWAVAKYRYFFWSLPEGVLEARFREGLLGPSIPVDVPGKVAEVMGTFLRAFRGLHEPRWYLMTINTCLNDTITELTSRNVLDREDVRKDSYVILRWALFGALKGLPVGRIMEILGREETLKRLELAKTVAERMAWQDKATVPLNTAQADAQDASAQ